MESLVAQKLYIKHLLQKFKVSIPFPFKEKSRQFLASYNKLDKKEIVQALSLKKKMTAVL